MRTKRIESDKPNQLPSPWQTFAILMAAVFIAEAFVMYLIHPFEDRLGHLFLVTLDASLLLILIAPLLWLFLVRPLRSKIILEQARAATVVSNAVDGIITIDGRGLIESFNPAAEKIFGFSADEVLGNPLTLLIPGRHRDAHLKGLERVQLTGKSNTVGKTLELHGLRNDGSEFPMELSISAWKAGKEMFFTGIVRDITERKRAEEKIHRDRAQLSILQDINAAATSTLDLGAVLNMLLDKIDILLPYAACSVSLMDPASGKLEPLAVRNLDETELKAIAERSGGGFRRIVLESKSPLVISNVQADSKLPLVTEFFIKHGLVSYLGLPLMAKGEAIGTISVLTKEEHAFTTEEINFLSTLAAQAATAIHNSQLFEQTKKQAAELEKAKDMQADFAAMIAHDLRSPLTATLSTATMLEDGLFGAVNQEQKRWLLKMQSNIHGLVELVNDFLDLSKLEAGHIQLSKEKVHLDQLIRESADNYLALAGEKKISLQTRIDPALPHINADPRRLDQVLSNLLSNAIKFTDREGKIEVGAGQGPDREISIWVKDSGVGIPPEEIGELFQKYKQTTSGIVSEYKGTGLGLVICKMIAEAHGGKIRVDSEEGKGSTFTVTIPLPQ